MTEVKELGSHHMFLAEVLGVTVDGAYMNENGRFELNSTNLVAYSHGTYFTLGQEIGTFGYSVRKKKPVKAAKKNTNQVSKGKGRR